MQYQGYWVREEMTLNRLNKRKWFISETCSLTHMGRTIFFFFLTKYQGNWIRQLSFWLTWATSTPTISVWPPWYRNLMAKYCGFLLDSSTLTAKFWFLYSQGTLVYANKKLDFSCTHCFPKHLLNNHMINYLCILDRCWHLMCLIFVQGDNIWQTRLSL